MRVSTSTTSGTHIIPNKKGSRYKDPIIYANGQYRDDTKGEYGDDLFLDYIIDFIGRKKDDDNPFFVYWPMALTHGPFEPTPDSPEWDAFRTAFEQDARRGRTWADLNDDGGEGAHPTFL